MGDFPRCRPCVRCGTPGADIGSLGRYLGWANYHVFTLHDTEDEDEDGRRSGQRREQKPGESKEDYWYRLVSVLRMRDAG